MCGPLALNFAHHSTLLGAYQFGRLVGYSAIGLIAGWIGQGATHFIKPSPLLSSIALLLVGATLVILGWRSWNHHPPHFPLPRHLQRLIASPWKIMRASTLPRILVAAISGLLTVFLPCAHLYGFVAGAMAIGSPLGGFLFMSVFWTSTLPALVIGPKAVMRLVQIAPASQRQRWMGVAFMAAGLLSLVVFASQLTHQQGQKGNDHDHHLYHEH